MAGDPRTVPGRKKDVEKGKGDLWWPRRRGRSAKLRKKASDLGMKIDRKRGRGAARYHRLGFASRKKNRFQGKINEGGHLGRPGGKAPQS